MDKDKKMIAKDYISIMISIVAMITSLGTAWFSFLSPASITIYPGEKITLSINDYITDDSDEVLYSKFGVMLPVILSNTGSKADLLSNFSIILEDTNNSENNHLLKYSRIMKVTDTMKAELKSDDLNNPILVDKYSTLVKYLYFETNSENFIPKPGEYKIHILAWNKEYFEKDAKPNFKCSTSITIKEEDINWLHDQKSAMIEVRDNKYLTPGNVPHELIEEIS